MAKSFCPHDGSPMYRAVKPLTLDYKGRSVTEDVSGWHCKLCGETVYDGADLQKTSRMLNRLRGDTLGFLEPTEIRRIRKKLRLTQNDAGLVIGGGLRAFQKYESGDLLPSRGIDSALRLLDHNPAQLALLDKRASQNSEHSTVRSALLVVESVQHL